jgi:hypothetical protein
MNVRRQRGDIATWDTEMSGGNEFVGAAQRAVRGTHLQLMGVEDTPARA